MANKIAVGRGRTERRHFRLRVVEGPLEGATYRLRESFLLGRSGACDLVLLDRGVSRLHARVTSDEAGEHVLCDLGSTNGTHVNGKPICERRLVAGDEIAVCSVRFLYERIPAEARRPTKGEDARPRSGDEMMRGCRLARERGYERDLLDDVIAYRSLAATASRGDVLDLKSQARLRDLASKFHDGADATRLRELPFPVRARVRNASAERGDFSDVQLCSLGAGGVSLHRPRERVALDDVMHLMLDCPDLGAPGVVVLTGVVVAVGNVVCRLAFSPSVCWAHRLSSRQQAATVRMEAIEPPKCEPEHAPRNCQTEELTRIGD